MSAWSDWKCGAMSDAEYRSECIREDNMDRAYREREEYELSCREYCQTCEGYNEETGECDFGEDMYNCMLR